MKQNICKKMSKIKKSVIIDKMNDSHLLEGEIEIIWKSMM